MAQPNQQAYATNAYFFGQEEKGHGSVICDLDLIKRQPNNRIGIHDIQSEGDTLVVDTKMGDPAALMVPDPRYPDSWRKADFVKLGGDNPDPQRIKEAEQRFGMDFRAVLESKRTIGAMSVVAFVFDRDKVASEEDRVQLAVVQRTKTGPDGTPNMGTLSRTGGQMVGGAFGQGVHGPQNIGCQSIREFWEEFHPFIRSEDGVLTPMDIIPQGYELDGLKGAFTTSAMDTRLEIFERIKALMESQGRKVSPFRETFKAANLHIPGLSKPVIQRIDGQEILHQNLIWRDLQFSRHNLDFNTDMVMAVRVPGLAPEDLILKDGETHQESNRLLDRIIFFGKPDELRRALNGEIIPFHRNSSKTDPAGFSPGFPEIIRSDALVKTALEMAP